MGPMTDDTLPAPPLHPTVTLNGETIEITSLEQAARVIVDVGRRVAELEERLSRLEEDTRDLAGRYNMHVESSCSEND